MVRARRSVVSPSSGYKILSGGEGCSGTTSQLVGSIIPHFRTSLLYLRKKVRDQRRELPKLAPVFNFTGSVPGLATCQLTGNKPGRLALIDRFDELEEYEDAISRRVEGYDGKAIIGVLLGLRWRKGSEEV